MAAVFAPLAEVERILKTVDGYVVIANVNSNTQSVIGGASQAVEQAMRDLPASRLQRCAVAGQPRLPYLDCGPRQRAVAAKCCAPAAAAAAGADCRQCEWRVLSHRSRSVPQMIDLLAQQVASPVQFVKGLHTLYDAGARVFVEVGPKKALQGFAEDVLGDRGDVVSLFTNHPKLGDMQPSTRRCADCMPRGWAAAERRESPSLFRAAVARHRAPVTPAVGTPEPVAQPAVAAIANHLPPTIPRTFAERRSLLPSWDDLFADVLDRGWEIYRGRSRPRRAHRS